MAMTEAGVQHLIVDSAAFIKNISLKDVGKEIYTVSGVVQEIKDRSTRERLQVLPYELHIKEPTPDCINAVSEFARKTGDYHSLSGVDIRVLALTYQFHRQFCGLDSINTRPVNRVIQNANTVSVVHENQSTISSTISPPHAAPLITQTSSLTAGSNTSLVDQIQMGAKCTGVVTAADATESELVEELSDEMVSLLIASALEPDGHDSEDGHVSEVSTSEVIEDEGCSVDVKDCAHPIEAPNRGARVVDEIDLNDKLGENCDGGEKEEKTVEEENNDEGDDEEEEEEEEEEEDDDDEGWITPSNYASLKHTLNNEVQSAKPVGLPVACITMDFAMQNVLMQMGLKVLAMDGMLIKRTNQYILRCHACFKVNADTSRQFCHHCGNATLRKVAMTVNEDGSVQIHLSQRKKLSARGLRYSLPLPKGGKRTNNPILCEDQRESQNQKMSLKTKAKFEALSVDYISHESPFAPTDVSSRAAVRHFTDQHNKRNRRNPNANNRRKK